MDTPLFCGHLGAFDALFILTITNAISKNVPSRSTKWLPIIMYIHPCYRWDWMTIFFLMWPWLDLLKWIEVPKICQLLPWSWTPSCVSDRYLTLPYWIPDMESSQCHPSVKDNDCDYSNNSSHLNNLRSPLFTILKGKWYHTINTEMNLSLDKRQRRCTRKSNKQKNKRK